MKKGSALIFVILIFSILLTLSVGLLQFSVASYKQSNNFVSKNENFYNADSAIDLALFILDAFSEKAREKAYVYCFKDGNVNTESPEVKIIYDQYMAQINDNNPNNDDAAYNAYKENLSKIYIKKYKEYLKTYLIDKADDQLLNLNLQVEMLNEKIEIDYWRQAVEYIYNKILSPIYPNVDFKILLYNEAIKDLEFSKVLGNQFNSSFEDFNLNSESYPRETIIIRSRNKTDNTKNYILLNCEFEPEGGGFVEGNLPLITDNILFQKPLVVASHENEPIKKIDDYVDFSVVGNHDEVIVIDNANKIYIYLDKNSNSSNIDIDLSNYDGYKVLIASKNNLYIKSTNNITIYGNIMVDKLDRDNSIQQYNVVDQQYNIYKSSFKDNESNKTITVKYDQNISKYWILILNELKNVNKIDQTTYDKIIKYFKLQDQGNDVKIVKDLNFSNFTTSINILTRRQIRVNN